MYLNPKQDHEDSKSSTFLSLQVSHSIELVEHVDDKEHYKNCHNIPGTNQLVQFRPHHGSNMDPSKSTKPYHHGNVLENQQVDKEGEHRYPPNNGYRRDAGPVDVAPIVRRQHHEQHLLNPDANPASDQSPNKTRSGVGHY
eukprot:CAMPEP_0113953364 /NCGR_PEP_ID=MMETSP1339-20121228/90933_1 /TAXON_ID=94617 /ORGANISM="Fibrocapsa japonica" /LENGTH=140 /DNA_ID=CAMNT_0000962087 /DNA_START=275 /DNA_END=697 /DNA_ORIENTATION=+ /assembly_acc=CAM_ASM_000762